MTSETERPDPAAPAEADRPADEISGKTAAPAADSVSGGIVGEAPCGPEDQQPKPPEQKPGEIGGPAGPEPTRYGDWEIGGRCSDF